MPKIRHHSQVSWYPTMDREFYDWDLFIHYANAKIEITPKAFYPLLKKIKKREIDSPYLLIRKNIDWLIEANTYKVQLIKLAKPDCSKEIPHSPKLDEEGEAGHILIENLKKKTMKVPIEFYTSIKEGIYLRSRYFNISHHDKLDDNENQYIVRSLFTDILNFGCPRKMKVFDSNGCSMNTIFDYSSYACVWRVSRKTIFGDQTEDLPCYVCDHRFFRFLLDELCKGKDFSEIEGLDSLTFNIPVESRSLYLSEVDGKTTKLCWETEYGLDPFFANEGQWNFPGIFLGAVTDSLIYFLAEKDRRRLKKCPICGDFFIAERDLKKKYCYPPKNCEQIAKRQTQRELMRKKRDKNGDDFDPRYL